MFPAHAGMNRAKLKHNARLMSVPRPRGDEPVSVHLGIEAYGVFPAHAGMNRSVPCGTTTRLCVPRPRGDEPGRYNLNRCFRECSPPTRG